MNIRYRLHSTQIEGELEQEIDLKAREIDNMKVLIATLKKNSEKHKMRISDLEKEIERLNVSNI
jgi:predicted RNase H-like nuclease (RuvC/YqgF family)